MQELTSRMTCELCYDGLGIVSRQLDECERILKAETRGELDRVKRRLERWHCAIKAHLN